MDSVKKGECWFHTHVESVLHGSFSYLPNFNDFVILAECWRRKWQPTPVFLLGESQGRGSLVGCSLWGRTESDTTEATTPMFIAALFIIARTWKQPRCPSADEWIRKLWYIYTVEYYSAIKKNTFESILMRWMKLEPIIQSEVSQKEKHQYSILPHIYGI